MKSVMKQDDMGEDELEELVRSSLTVGRTGIFLMPFLISIAGKGKRTA